LCGRYREVESDSTRVRARALKQEKVERVGGQWSGTVFWLLSDELGCYHTRKQEKGKREWERDEQDISE